MSTDMVALPGGAPLNYLLKARSGSVSLRSDVARAPILRVSGRMKAVSSGTRYVRSETTVNCLDDTLTGR